MKHTTRKRMLATAALVLAGCPTAPEPEPEPELLAEGSAWERVDDLDADVFADQRPADAFCDDAGWVVDPFTHNIEFQTLICNYVTLGQTTLEPLAPGDVVTVSGYHDALTADTPALGYVALAIDGQIDWELEVAIPAEPASFEESFTIERSVPEGADIQFHLHNHGANTWELVSVMVVHAS